MLPYRSVRLLTLAARGIREDVRSTFLSQPAGVTLPPLRVGANMLKLFDVRDGLAAERPQTLPPHRSHVHGLADVLVQSNSGIVTLERTAEVLEDTLDHTDPERDGYDREPKDDRREGTLVRLRAPERTVTGRHLSLLLGSQSSHFHWLLMNVGRLAIIKPEELSACDGVLIPADLGPARLGFLRGLPALRGLPFREVAPRESLRVESLLLPWNVANGTSFDPNLVPFLRRVMATGTEDGLRSQQLLCPDLIRASAPNGTMARAEADGRIKSGQSETTHVDAFYIDRRRSQQRPLLNEDEIIDAVSASGIVPVRLETLSIAGQAALFRQARLVVAPHGAGLSNIVFAPPGLRVIELMPSGCLNWCYRILAAHCGHDYDVVIGRSKPTGSVAPIWQPWVASPTHVVSALQAILPLSARNTSAPPPPPRA